MIRISIDDSVSESNRFESLDSVGDVLNDVLAHLPPNRVVTSIWVDGAVVVRQQSSEALKSRLEAIRELQIHTADAHSFAANGIDRAISDVGRLQKTLMLSAEFFRDDRKLEGNRIFLHCIEGLERFLDTIVLTRLATKFDFTRMEVDGISFARLEKDFASILNGIVDCQTRQDFDGLADKLEYELLPNFASWMRALHQLRLSMHSNA
jgi:hypothetical protein